MSLIIGLDFDNTIVTYDGLFHRLALECRLIGDDSISSKRGIRDAVRQRPDGERDWQRLQADAYGPRMAEAIMTPGVAAFLTACRTRQLPVHIISHRTERASLDSTGTNLRDAAFEWMAAHRFFEPTGFGLDPSRVCFEATRAAKVARIGKVGCTHFVDDLEEVFAEPAFPREVTRVLFTPHTDDCRREPLPNVTALSTWEAIGELILGRE
jgi:hypothetical protein